MRHAVLLALSALLPLTAQSFDLDMGRPAQGWQVAVTDFEGEAKLTGDRVTCPSPPIHACRPAAWPRTAAATAP
jgi:beta-glucosidase